MNVPIGVVGVIFTLRVMPETYDLTATQDVDWYKIVLLKSSIFCLTYRLVEANNKG